MKFKLLFLSLILICVSFAQIAYSGDTDKMPGNFVDIQKVIPDVLLDIRY